jgi:signal transduction histidine kinase
MAGLIRQLLDFSRRQGTRFGVASLRAIATRAVDVLAAFARRRGVRLELETADDVMIVSADENQIQQALTNVIMNGVQAMPDGGRLLVTVRPRRARPPDGDAASEDEYLCVTVEDQGHGITPEHLAHIFEPFFTTKGIGEGTGLGLSVAYGIVREHGGWIAVDSEVGKGSRFCIFLPRAADAGAPGSEVAL